jgi:hypothetical protein
MWKANAMTKRTAASRALTSISDAKNFRTDMYIALAHHLEEPPSDCEGKHLRVRERSTIPNAAKSRERDPIPADRIDAVERKSIGARQ